MKRAVRAYFRIQEKHPTCSKRASYIRNTSWPDSPRLMKVSVTIGLSRLSSFHIPSCTFSISSRRFWEYLDDRRNWNLDIFYAFFKNSVKVSPPWFIEGNFRFSRTSKTPVLSFCEYICLKKKYRKKKHKQSMVSSFHRNTVLQVISTNPSCDICLWSCFWNGLTVKTYTYNYARFRRFTLANVRKIKAVNCFHFQVEQLLG